MMLPNQLITANTPTGGSPYQQMTRGQQAGSFAGAHMVTAGTQGVAGGMDGARTMQQGLNTAAHQQATAGLNFQPGPPDNEVRNAQKSMANRLLMDYKTAMAEAGAVDMSNMARLGQLLG
jgi:hypothetical protein